MLLAADFGIPGTPRGNFVVGRPETESASAGAGKVVIVTARAVVAMARRRLMRFLSRVMILSWTIVARTVRE